MKKIKIAVVGYGNRGQVYADYSLDEPNEVEVVAIIDPNEYKWQIAKERYGLTDGQVFACYADFVQSGLEVDLVVNATMEQQHYQTAVEILNSRHHMLIEKPIVSKKEELNEIRRLAKENECMVFVCHVLRYSPYYKRVKSILQSGELGKIVSMEMNEHVWVPHFATSYVRGKWNSEAECGSPILLAKCSHDMDLICWLNSSKVDNVSSFGSRRYFLPKNAPEGATEYCFDCPHKAECPYDAEMMYLKRNVMPFLVWDALNKPYDEITDEEKRAFLEKSIYGKCIFTCGGDVVDRQVVAVEFEDGSTAAFTLSCGATKPDRYLHIVCTGGEIEGKLEENKFVIRKYKKEDVWFSQETVDLSSEIVNNAKYGGHSGGDYGIMYDLVRYLNGEQASNSITLLEDAAASHLLVYAAERSRKNGGVQKL